MKTKSVSIGGKIVDVLLEDQNVLAAMEQQNKELEERIRREREENIRQVKVPPAATDFLDKLAKVSSEYVKTIKACAAAREVQDLVSDGVAERNGPKVVANFEKACQLFSLLRTQVSSQMGLGLNNVPKISEELKSQLSSEWLKKLEDLRSKVLEIKKKVMRASWDHNP